jgi:hypothetical protein
MLFKKGIAQKMNTTGFASNASRISKAISVGRSKKIDGTAKL